MVKFVFSSEPGATSDAVGVNTKPSNAFVTCAAEPISVQTPVAGS